MLLTGLELENAKPDETNQKLSDGGGLYLLVKPHGGRYGRLEYRFGGKEKLLAVGVFSETSLSAAREKREDARRLLASGVDPGADRKEEKRIQVFKSQNTFEAIGRERWEAKKGAWSTKTWATRTASRKPISSCIASIDRPGPSKSCFDRRLRRGDWPSSRSVLIRQSVRCAP